MNKLLFGLLVFLITFLAQGGRAWGANDALYIPSLGANATGTAVGAKKTLDVSIPAGLTITDPAEGTPGAAQPLEAIMVGGSDGTNLRAIHVDASGDIQADRTWTLSSGTDSCSAVQSGTWNINNISGTVSLPTGASTAANQTTANTSLSSIDGKLPALVSGRVPVDGSGVTQPISAASLPLPTGASTAANQSTANTSLASIDGKITAVNTGAVVISSSALPTGASTSANQTTINTSIGTMSAKLPAALGQTTASGSLSVVLASDQASVSGRTYLTSVRNAYSTTSVTTGAWVQLIASTSGVANEVEIFDSSGQTLELGVGAAASETRTAIIVPGGNGRIPLKIASGTRISVRAISATASVGELDINFYQ